MMYGLAPRFLGLLSLLALFALAAPACTAKNDPPASEPGPASPSGSGGAGGMTATPSGGQGGNAGGEDPGPPSGGQQGGSPVVDAGPMEEPDAEPVDLPPPDPVNVNACQHLQAGPFVPLMAQAGFPLPADTMAPAIKSDAQAYRIVFPRLAEGYVTFTPPAEGNYVLYTSTPLPIAVFSLAGFLLDPVSLDIKAQECMEIKGKHIFHFASSLHVVRLGPDSPNTVDIVVVPAMPATMP